MTDQQIADPITPSKLAEIAKLTDNNNHNKARQVIAEHFGMSRLSEVFGHIRSIQMLEGSMAYNLIKYRSKLTNEMLSIIEAQHGTQIAEQVSNQL